MSSASLREKELVELGLSQHEALHALECTKAAAPSSPEQNKLVKAALNLFFTSFLLILMRPCHASLPHVFLRVYED